MTEVVQKVPFVDILRGNIFSVQTVILNRDECYLLFTTFISIYSFVSRCRSGEFIEMNYYNNILVLYALVLYGNCLLDIIFVLFIFFYLHLGIALSSYFLCQSYTVSDIPCITKLLNACQYLWKSYRDMVAVVGSASCRMSNHGIALSRKKPFFILTY